MIAKCAFLADWFGKAMKGNVLEKLISLNEAWRDCMCSLRGTNAFLPVRYGPERHGNEEQSEP